ncbi:hypothetical protein [Pontixanthobacter aquaemixtae]|uniref:Uncharacterized protein n=1 Tax=Pontixanthobacter aquaemixtae TaxID=1958940 RepID=A0A844ZRL8_9SPHN|nr:hypothetical protein [Pontixanthobacter aquaemixtae]MXO90164.1 hypothetical protein [Pontixanthobacter aquaemixtae]
MQEKKNDLLEDAKEEFAGMAKGGMQHPATKPVLKGAAVGAAAGFLLPGLSVAIGAVAGAGFMFYDRIRK